MLYPYRFLFTILINPVLLCFYPQIFLKSLIQQYKIDQSVLNIVYLFAGLKEKQYERVYGVRH
jgi:hypothetical protein